MYKRQTGGSAKRGSYDTNADMNIIPFIDIPVSYTHLDVYKRQVLFILVACAVYALSLLFEKILVMRSNKAKISNFITTMNKAKTPDEASQAVAKQPDSIAKRMFAAGYAEVLKTRELGLYNMKTGDHTLGRIQTAMDIEQNKGCLLYTSRCV